MKEKMIRIMENDTELLRKHQLIDYSLFLLEVDRQERLNKKDNMASVVFDVTKNQLKLKSFRS